MKRLSTEAEVWLEHWELRFLQGNIDIGIYQLHKSHQ